MGDVVDREILAICIYGFNCTFTADAFRLFAMKDNRDAE